jgi:hypothetical protein
MHVCVLGEYGYEEAGLGLSLSFMKEAGAMDPVMRRLCTRDGGHNKFLESIMLWMDVTAPRHFWQQFDTYRVGITKQSGSTMHTLLRGPLSQSDFEAPLPAETLARLNELVAARDLVRLKNELPEGFLQRRVVCTNYKVLRNIVGQRRTHRSPCWAVFCEAVVRQAEHPEFLHDLWPAGGRPASEDACGGASGVHS